MRFGSQVRESNRKTLLHGHFEAVVMFRGGIVKYIFSGHYQERQVWDWKYSGNPQTHHTIYGQSSRISLVWRPFEVIQNIILELTLCKTYRYQWGES